MSTQYVAELPGHGLVQIIHEEKLAAFYGSTPAYSEDSFILLEALSLLKSQGKPEPVLRLDTGQPLL